MIAEICRNPMLSGWRFLIVLIFMGAGASGASADRRITVNGECAVEVEPDRGSVVIVADHQDKDAKTAIAKATALHEKLRAELKKSKVKNLELSNVEYSVQEITAWEENKQVSKGFQCRIGVKAVTPDIAGLGEVLSIAAEAGVRNSHSLETYLSDGKMLEEKKRCLGIAAKNAREKASHLAATLGAKLGEVQVITEQGAPESRPGPMPRAFAMKGMEAASADAPTLEGGKQRLHHEVEVTFAIDP